MKVRRRFLLGFVLLTGCVIGFAQDAAALAPRRITFVKEPPGSFGFTRSVYRLRGSDKQFMVAPSLLEAVRW